MDFNDVIKNRRSVRAFKTKKVSINRVREIIKKANLSPSAGNLQARAVIIVKDKKIIDKIREVSKGCSRFANGIPLLLILLAKPEESALRYKNRGSNLYSIQDATIMAAYIQLIAFSKGIDSCWIGSFNEELISEIIGIPGDLKPVAMIPLGYALEKAERKERKNLKEIIHKEI